MKVAREFGDRAAERRAHSNLGNAHIFLGEFEKAADHYKKTLHLAQGGGCTALVRPHFRVCLEVIVHSKPRLSDSNSPFP